MALGVISHLARMAYMSFVDALFKWGLGFVENSYGTFIRKLTTFLSCRNKMNVQGYWGWQEVVGVLSFVAVLALLAS
ncbi:hypothetical protein [Pseudomonas fluorescens]|uniref:hypothetical protein n=1 Tax=Pseudomonas fluorescens TaxID=294 RepID=UPI0012404F01|nr:hypothetical protein [Pseudomonas fluorescens]